MKVKEVMNTVNEDAMKCCTSESSLAEVAKMMKDVNIGSVPIVDKDKKVVGIVTDRDVALSFAGRTNKSAAEIMVRDIMSSTRIRTIKAEDNLTDAMREMRKNRIGRLPVVDNEGKLKGIISVNNLLTNALDNKEDLGSPSSSDENLARTISALFERNNSQTVPGKMEMEPGEE